MLVLKRKRNLWFVFVLLVLTSNIFLYNTTIGLSLISSENRGVVLGSLLDLAIITPLAVMFTHKNFSLKKFIMYAAIGCIAARLIIPIELLQPYLYFTWIGFAVEGIILFIEISVLVTLVVYMPKIIRYVKASSLPLIFSFPKAISRYMKSQGIVQIISSELLMFYYAIGTWRKKNPDGITLYKNTSYIAMQVMIIHAIILETLGIHWWLHGVAPIVSIVLLLLNVYSIFFFLADMQAMRLTPLVFEENEFYISAGLLKQVNIPYDMIEEVVTDAVILEQKLEKDTLQFIVRDFEALQPTVILKMKQPVEATFYMGIKKTYTKVAIRVDQPERFMQQLTLKMERY